MSILFKEDGYIEAINFGTSNKDGQTGIIYSKKGNKSGCNNPAIRQESHN